MKEYDIPQDAQWGDIDIMDRSLDFTISKDRFGGLAEYARDSDGISELPYLRFGGLAEYVDLLKAEGVKFVTILDPCISTGEPNCTYRPFDLGQELDVWVKKPNGDPVTGQVWPLDPVYFPDYTNPRTKAGTVTGSLKYTKNTKYS